MRRPVIWLTLILAGLSLYALLSEHAQRINGQSDGAAHAQRDIALGKVGMKGCGKPMYWQKDFEAVAASEYGLLYERVASCTPTTYQRNYVLTYNKAMKTHWDSREFDPFEVESRARAMAEARLSSSSTK